MNYYAHDENQLEKSKKDAIIKKLRDEVDDMKVKYCLKDKMKKQSSEETNHIVNEVENLNMQSNDNEGFDEEEGENAYNNNFDYNNLSPKNDVFNSKYKIIDYNKFNSDDYNNNMEQQDEAENQEEIYENEEYYKFLNC